MAKQKKYPKNIDFLLGLLTRYYTGLRSIFGFIDVHIIFELGRTLYTEIITDIVCVTHRVL